MKRIASGLGAGMFSMVSLLAIALPTPVVAADATASELGIMQGFVPAEGKRVSAANWNLYPLNRWAFQNVRRFMPTAALVHDPATTVPLPIDMQNLDNLSVELDSGSKTVNEIMESWQTDSLVVLHNGTLVYERYWNGMTPSKPHWVASVSKSYVGTLGAMLVERGVLDRDRTIESYVPELTDSGFAGATVGQMLDMTGGTAWDESPRLSRMRIHRRAPTFRQPAPC